MAQGAESGGRGRQGGRGGGGEGGNGAGGGGRGPGGGGRGPGAGGRGNPDRQVVRTVYVMPKDIDATGKEPPKTGISDGVMTEVIEGLNEGDQVVIGSLASSQSAMPGAPAANPFGGGFRGGRF